MSNDIEYIFATERQFLVCIIFSISQFKRIMYEKEYILNFININYTTTEKLKTQCRHCCFHSPNMQCILPMGMTTGSAVRTGRCETTTSLGWISGLSSVVSRTGS